MDPRDLLNQIPAQDLPGSDIFTAYRRGEISWDDWITMSAIRAVETESDVPPTPYPPMPETARAYALGRQDDRLKYDYPMAKRMGDWFFAVIKTDQHNRERQEHFTWAAGVCKRIGLEDHVERARSAFERYERAIPPYADIELAMIVKRKDAIARQGGAA